MFRKRAIQVHHGGGMLPLVGIRTARSTGLNMLPAC
jgi:hypothetical protein